MKREFQQSLLDKGLERLPNVLIAAAECAPISKTGGLADVVGTLPKSLAELGMDARVITPYHRCVKDKYRDRVEHMFSFSVDLGWRSQYVGIERLVLDGVTIYLVDNEYYFGDRIYRGGQAEGEQYAFFTRAVLDAIPNLGFFPDVLHCNDWHTAMLPMLLRTQYGYYVHGKIKTLLTIHNIFYQGKFVVDAFKAAKADNNIFVYYIASKYKSALGLSDEACFDIYEDALLRHHFNAVMAKRVIDSLLRIAPGIDEAKVKTSLKKLNRLYSPYLIKDKAAWEPVVATIRTALETY